jgi:hypothetical protein
VAPWLTLLNLFVVVVLAPIGEELFFRGWLWTGLRRRWDALPTALVTATFWLVLHLDRGVATAVALLPLAIILSLARQIGNSVRASIPLHAVYNLAVDLPLVLIVFGFLQYNASAVSVVMPPANGKVRFAEMQVPIQRAPGDPLSRCNGKPVDAVLVFYKSNAGFVGMDTVMIDVDFRHGVVRRFIYTLSVR